MNNFSIYFRVKRTHGNTHKWPDRSAVNIRLMNIRYVIIIII